MEDLKNEKDNVIIDNQKKKVIFQSIELSNSVCSIEEKIENIEKLKKQ